MSQPDLNVVLKQLVATEVAAQIAALPPAPAQQPDWFDTPGAATYLGMRPITLEVWRSTRKGPRFHKPARSVVRYARADLDTWLASTGRRKRK